MCQDKKRLKLICVIVLFLLFFIYRFFLDTGSIFREGNNSRYCFYDKWLLDYTKSVNIFASQNLWFRDIMMIFASNALDVLMISFLIYYVKNGGCRRTLLSLLMFYGLRGILQNFFLFSYYENYLFDHPGFISFVVPFYRAADFFYSGHCGCAFILALTFRDIGENKLYYFGLFVLFLQFFVMTSITRAHYSIDAIFGIIAAHYFYIFSEKILNFKRKEVANSISV